jgi:hypothetical protein
MVPFRQGDLGFCFRRPAIESVTITPKRDAACTGVLAVGNQLQATAREVPLDIAGHWHLVGFTAQQLRLPTRDTD